MRAPRLDDHPWSMLIDDPEGGEGPAGPVRLAGLRGGPNSGDLYLLVHGLGGDAERPYMREAAAAIRALGHASLRVSMRGAGRSSADFYHAGLASDLERVLADPALAGYARVFVLGFSLGGHVSIQLGLRATRDPRIAAVVAICAPLDLARTVELIDQPRAWIYRRHVLDGLAKIHVKVHGRSPRFRSIRQWDMTTVVPRYGFDSVEHYWRSQSAGPQLREVGVPLLFVATTGDPMVPAETLRPYLARAGAGVDVRWARRGGHVGFPANMDLGLPGELGLFNQVLTWCSSV
ncbi:Hydrolase, alpha/beta fold family protein [Enhygromyxa salina]|uniref:Hydrolase, alpha/beta fold family protein n=1 Tax=Enhygromyxa salina TaxID=215803 RepID=A0A0C1ZVC3_9BACT|nr:alpha/beta fold hydrolase [Enhygromyxa salina]KIG15013.1 Hydrolase, alpha/beta fold family protein [Enhygromyxa salina]